MPQCLTFFSTVYDHDVSILSVALLGNIPLNKDGKTMQTRMKVKEMRSSENFWQNEVNKSHRWNLRAIFLYSTRELKVANNKMDVKLSCVDLVHQTGTCGSLRPATWTDAAVF
jgi:hypothetical protein